jgi:hypothetical protein
MVCVLLQEEDVGDFSFMVYDKTDNPCYTDRHLSIIPSLDKFEVGIVYDEIDIYFTIGGCTADEDSNICAYGIYYIDSEGASCTKYEVVVMAESMAKDLAEICKIISQSRLVFYDLKFKMVNVYKKYIKQIKKIEF